MLICGYRRIGTFTASRFRKRTVQCNRRQFCSLLFAAPAVFAQKPPEILIDRGFARVSRLAGGVFATIADPGKGPQCLSNGGVIVGSERILLIEGHFQPAGAALEIEAARRVSKAPILAALNTHYHLDHTFGNQAYAARRIAIIAHERAPILMRERYAALKPVDKAKRMAPLRNKIAATTNPLEKKRLQGDLQAEQWTDSAIDAVTLAYPAELVTSAQAHRKIDLGGISVVVESHAGHTPTDLIVRIPEHDIVFTGDLLFYHAYPVAFDSDPVAWRKVLEMFLAYPDRIRFIPGHGPVCGKETVRVHLDIMDDLQAHAQKMQLAGIPLEEAKQRYIVPPRFRDFDYSWWEWTIGSAVEKYYR